MLARVAQELDQGQLAQPVEVVDHHRGVAAGREVEESLELAADTRDVDRQRLAVEQVPLRRPPGRVADHPGPAAHDRDGSSAEPLQAEQAEDRHEVADVERRPGRIEPDVAGDRRVAREPGGQAGRRRMQDAAPAELAEQPAGAVLRRVRHRAERRAVSTKLEATVR